MKKYCTINTEQSTYLLRLFKVFKTRLSFLVWSAELTPLKSFASTAANPSRHRGQFVVHNLIKLPWNLLSFPSRHSSLMSWLNVYSQIVWHFVVYKIFWTWHNNSFSLGVLVGSFQDFKYLLSCLICHSLSDFSLHFNCLLHQPFYPFQFCTPFRSFQSISETTFIIGHHLALSFKPMSNNALIYSLPIWLASIF